MGWSSASRIDRIHELTPPRGRPGQALFRTLEYPGLPIDMAVDYFRAVLVSAGVLPVRDEYMARLERWIEHKTAAIEDLEDEISIPARPRRIFHRPLDADERWATARRFLNDDSIETRDRVAGLMVLLFGQYPARTCRLTTAHVIHDENGVALRLNRTPLRLPPPLDALVLQLVDIANDHQHAVMSNDLNAPCLFPTQRPGQPLGSKLLSRRLGKIGLSTESGRCAALLDLCTQMPPAVLQRLLGISPAASERWAAGAVRTAYAAEVARR